MKILVDRCYCETTPESAAEGENSDCGFVYENESLTFSELVRLIKREGFYREGATEWLTTGFHVIDYKTMTEREETLHFSDANPERLRKWFELALKA